MDKILQTIESINGEINNVVWGAFGLLLLVGTGIIAVLTSSLAWDIADTFNGLMMIPNLIGVLTLSPLVVKITKNYLRRVKNGEDIEPMYNVDPEIQKQEMAREVAEN